MVVASKEVLFVPASKYFLKNKFFSPQPDPSNARTTNNFWFLRQHFSKLGYEMKTVDMSSDISSAFAIIFMEVPTYSNPHYKYCIKQELFDNMYLVASEPQSIHPPNHDPTKHANFKRVLTWNDDLVDDKKYLKLFYTIPVHFAENVKLPKYPFEKKKLACMINSNKFSPYVNELYSERIRAIRFMEHYHLQDFDLFGHGWDFPIIHNGIINDLKVNAAVYKFWSRMPKIFRVNTYPSFSGLGYKQEVLPKYKFTFAYENQTGGDGYISEKILESFLFGSVPVYLGDQNIEKVVPPECFIDKREYPDYESLYLRLASIEKEEHAEYLDRIEGFLNSKEFYPFTIDSFVGSFEKLLDVPINLRYIQKD